MHASPAVSVPPSSIASPRSYAPDFVLPKMQRWNSDSLRNFKSAFRRSLLLQGLSSTAQTLFKGHNKMLQQLLSLCVGSIPMLCSAPVAVQAL